MSLSISIKTILETILAKKILLTFSFLCGVAIFFLFDSLLISILSSIAILLFVYFYFIGPMHLASKRALESLVDNKSLFCRKNDFISRLNKREASHCHGYAVFDRFTEPVLIFKDEGDIFLSTENIPYLPLYELNQRAIKGFSDKFIESTFVRPEDNLKCGSISFENNYTIILYAPENVLNCISKTFRDRGLTY